MLCRFPNLGIQHATRKNVVEVLEKKIIEQMKFNNKIMGDALNAGDISAEVPRKYSHSLSRRNNKGVVLRFPVATVQRCLILSN